MSPTDQPEDDDLTRVEIDGDADAPAIGDAPAWIGPYRLLELLGSGGMGEVYLAQQIEPVERQVAIKLIRGQRREALSRALFEVERALLARLQHPYIAQVLDAGETEHGQPWFAMEWVPGDPIMAYVGQYVPSRKARLGLFLRVCQGVQHAHQRGILHRDLKPANILVSEVDGRHWPKIIDFGIATSLSGDGLPETAISADRAGTRAYMSPEQLAGDPASLDTRTDVYALGVLLFELLTGQRPLIEHSAAALTSFCQVLQTRQATAASAAEPRFSPEAKAAARALPLELRWIIVRAIAPQRDQRYASAAALAEDIQRYLDDLPVTAVPSSTRYRATKFIRRHRLSVAAGSLVGVALLVGLGLAAWGLTEAQAERDRAQIEAERAMQTVNFVRNVFDSIDPIMAQGYDTALLRRVLNDAADRAMGELASQPAVLADVQFTFGHAYRSIGELQRARDQWLSAVALTEAAGPESLFLRASNRLAGAELAVAENDAALARSRRVLERLGALERRGEPVRLLRLVAMHNQAIALDALQRREEADAVFRHALSLTEDAAEPDLIAERLEILRSIAQTYSDRFDFDQAIALFEQAKAEAEAWPDPRAEGVVLSLLNDLAVAYLRQQYYAEVESVLREALERAEALYGPDHIALSAIISNLAGSLRQQGRPAEALPYYLRALELIRGVHGNDHPRTLVAEHNLGNGLRDVGRVDEALVLHRDVLERALVHMQDEVFVLGMFRLGLGRTALGAGLPEEARAVLGMASDQLEASAGPEFHRTLEARDYLARAEAALAQAGNSESARP
ncbi:MAG: protein kinase domain-containing protein [Wenzhouxiangella sp.]